MDIHPCCSGNLEQAIGEYDGLLAAVNNATTASMKTALQAIGDLFRITVDQMAGLL